MSLRNYFLSLVLLVPVFTFAAVPEVTDFVVTTSLNTDYTFVVSDFNNAFTDSDGDPISTIRISNIPVSSRGTLIYDGATVVYGDMNLDIPFSDIGLGKLIFRPATSYEGTCNIRWNATDGGSYAVVADYMVIKIGDYLDGCTAEMPSRIKSIVLQKTREFSSAGTNPYIMPLIGDLNGDGNTDILSGGSVIRILDPSQTTTAAATQVSYTPSPAIMSGGNASSLAIGDLFTYNDGTNTVTSSANDGLAEIVYYGAGDKLVCLSVAYNSGVTSIEEVWEITLFNPSVADRSTVSIHDLNDDGIAEIICDGGVYDSQTGAFMLDLYSMGNYKGYNYKTAIFSTVSVYDVLTGISGNEILYGHEVLSTSITSNAGTAGNSATLERDSGQEDADGLGTLTDGVVSLADMDLDGDVDAVVSSRGYVYVWDIQSEATLLSVGYYDLPNGGDPSISGQPVINDFDNDGIPEFGVVSNLRITVFEDILNSPTLTPLWIETTTDASGVTNLVSFDIFGTGEAVLAYRDETSIRIFNGASSELLYSESGCNSGTGTEGPAIVDVDNDGLTEIVCSCDGKIAVFEPTITPWKPARSVWNQNNYNAINVADDLSIQGNLNDNHSTGGLNSHLSQEAAAGIPGGTGIEAYDLNISVLSVNSASCPGTVDITYRIRNAGSESVTLDAVPVSVFENNPFASGSSFKTSQNVSATLASGASTDVVVTVSTTGDDVLFGVINHDGSFDDIREESANNPQSIISFPRTALPECDYSNNLSASVEIASCVVFPVEWLDVSASWKSPMTASINWRTASESDVDFFAVQRKEGDIGEWESVKEVRPLGKAGNGASYSVNDAGVSPAAQQIQYRISQTDYNGNINYSPSIELRRETSQSEFSIYPNPIQNRLILSYHVNSQEQVSVEIRDVTNRLVDQVTLSAGTQSGVNEVNTASWPRGMYVVTVFEGTYSKKMMILKN